MTHDGGIGVHRDPFTDEIVASDTFEVPAQAKFYIAGEEVSERVYRRHEGVCQQRDLAMRAMCIYCLRRWTADQVHRGHHDVCGDCHRENQRARRQVEVIRRASRDTGLCSEQGVTVDCDRAPTHEGPHYDKPKGIYWWQSGSPPVDVDWWREKQVIPVPQEAADE